MQATKGITYDYSSDSSADAVKNLVQFNVDPSLYSTASMALQNWLDVDGTTSGRGVPTIMGSARGGANDWWKLDNACSLLEPAATAGGVLWLCDQVRDRQVGHLEFHWHDDIQGAVGTTSCGNSVTSDTPCPIQGHITHFGRELSQGLEVRSNAAVSGVVGGFGWYFHLAEGSPVVLTLSLIQVHESTVLLLALPYPSGTAFEITGDPAFWCSADSSATCAHEFSAVGSVDDVRNGNGDTFYFEDSSGSEGSSTGTLYVRVVQQNPSCSKCTSWVPNYPVKQLKSNGVAIPYFK